MYRYHYVMIVEDSEMKFWKDVFRSVKEAAEEQDALVELMGGSMSSDLEIGDYIDMSIAAKVDGIILEYIGNRSGGSRRRRQPGFRWSPFWRTLPTPAGRAMWESTPTSWDNSTESRS